jgi:hypothetical protein
MQVLMVEKAELRLKDAFKGISVGLRDSPQMRTLATKTVLFQFIFAIASLQNIIGYVISWSNVA